MAMRDIELLLLVRLYFNLFYKFDNNLKKKINETISFFLKHEIVFVILILS